MRGSMREKRPGVWELRVYAGRDPVTDRKRWVSRTVHGGRRAAEDQLRVLVGQHGGQVDAAEVTVSRLLDEWLATIEPDRSPTTIREYRRLCDVHLRPAFGGKPLAKLSPGDLDGLYRRLRGTLAASSVTRVHACIRAACNFAVDLGWLQASPAARAHPPRTVKAETEPPTVSELARILGAADMLDPDLGVLLRVAAAIGARRGELVGLQWVDVEGSTVRIRRNVVDAGGRLVVKDPKWHQSRRLSIDAGTVAVLEAHRGRMVERASVCGVVLPPSGFVFSREPDGSRPLRPEWVTRGFGAARTAAGVPGRVRLHDLRHLNASLMLAAGVPLRTVSARLGHERTSTTQDIYAHELPGADEAAADAIGRLLGGTSHPPAVSSGDGRAGGVGEEGDGGGVDRSA